MSGIGIEQVKAVVEENLPGCWPALEACLSLIAATMLKDIDHCMGLILVGPPGGRKTTTLDLLGRDNPIEVLHNFTPASFVSHDATKKPEQLAAIDLLPQIRHRVLVIPELAPIFGQRHEDLIRDMSILTAVMDGKGYRSASGAHGQRGYEGDYRFNLLGATVPLPHRAWEALNMLSSRWVFYNLGRTNELPDLRSNFSARKAKGLSAVATYLSQFWKGAYSVEWDTGKDDRVWNDMLVWSAECISAWRGLIPRQDHSGFNPPIIEMPHRLAQTLYGLARGHALLWNRNKIDWSDICFAIDINETNMPEDRIRVLQALGDKSMKCYEAGGKAEDLFEVGLGLREASRAIGCSTDKARSVMDELVMLGVIRREDSVTGATTYHRQI